MPLFGSRFSPKKTPPRKPLNLDGDRDAVSQHNPEELLNERRTVKLCLDDSEIHFEKGIWIPASGYGGNTLKINRKLRKKLQELQEENNLLKLKFDIILDMLTQTTAESHLLQREVEKMTKQKETNEII